MNVKTLLSGIQKTSYKFEVSGLSLNTQSLEKGDIFVAIQGTQKHGSEFVQNAIDKGCIAILVEDRDIQCSVPSIRIDNLSSYLSDLAQTFYQEAQNIKLIGVTGTNGKTSVSLFISQLLKALNVRTGVIGTLGISHSDNKIYNTTPDIFTIYKSLQEYSKKGIEVAVIEASSHALMQNRLSGLAFEQAIFTNLTQDHLDYHETMEQYREAKGKLFSNSKAQTVIINRDDENHSYFLDIAEDKLIKTFSIDDFSDYQLSTKGFICRLFNFVFELPLLGHFNLSNALAAFVSIKSLGYSNDLVIPNLAKLSPPPGRMQKLDNNNIWIDYAHTPDALTNALQTLRLHYPESKLRVVFGCGGDRDKSKRQQMGKIASELAHSIILTNDNPRNELPESIIKDIMAGVKIENSTQVITDRKIAINTAITTLNEDEVLLIAGKGHETTQILGSKALPFSDIEIALDALI
jgi:UDP-N-acetylmuramoyl-L-alanyl-D-glutamate--2,6-diaminopimelate ligase